MDKKVLYILFTILLISQVAFAEVKSTCPIEENAFNNHIKTLFVPSGVKTDAVLSQEINSNTAVVGQAINAILIDDFKYKNIIIAPCGSIIEGSIVYNRKAGYANKPAQMQIRFTKIRTPYNNLIPINAVILTSDSTGMLIGGTIKDNSKGHAGENENSNQTALTGGLGVIKTINSKGGNILIPPNSKISLIFDQPITVSAQ